MIYPNKPLYLLSLLGYIYYLTYYTLTTKDNIYLCSFRISYHHHPTVVLHLFHASIICKMVGFLNGKIRIQNKAPPVFDAIAGILLRQKNPDTAFLPYPDFHKIYMLSGLPSSLQV